MDSLRQCLFREAQQGLALIIHKLFEEGLLDVTDEQKDEAKTIIADILHGSRRRLEKRFCKEEGSAQTDGRGTIQA